MKLCNAIITISSGTLALAAAEQVLMCPKPTLFRQRFDGVCNNQRHPEFGAHLALKRRQTLAYYDDGMDEMVTKDRPSARSVSNALCDPDLNPDGLLPSGNFKSSSLLLIYFGQFLDHDMALVEVSDERADISVDPEDAAFDEDLIFRRSLFRRDDKGRRQFENENTAYLDLSNIYGDTTERATALRKLDGSGELKSLFRYGSQEYLPLFRDVFGDVFAQEEEVALSDSSSSVSPNEEGNSETSSPNEEGNSETSSPNEEPNSETSSPNEEGNSETSSPNEEPNSETSSPNKEGEEAPVVVDENFACGDIRCNENPVLTAITTLFVRNHNRLARKYKLRHPHAKERRVFNQARRRNIMMYQSLIYTEWLPTLLGKRNVARYTSTYGQEGYIEALDPGSSVVFSTAAFRFGHSGIANTLVEARPSGSVEEVYLLKDVFFQPSRLLRSNVSLDQFLSGVRVLEHEALDTRVVNAIRNELFGNVDVPLDLAALNIQRGRDHGLNTFNAYRVSLGLEPYVDCVRDDCWLALTRHAELAKQLRRVYSDNFDAMDVFVAGMAEHKLGDSHLGETFTLLILQQFETFRQYVFRLEVVFYRHERMCGNMYMHEYEYVNMYANMNM